MADAGVLAAGKDEPPPGLTKSASWRAILVVAFLLTSAERTALTERRYRVQVPFGFAPRLRSGQAQGRPVPPCQAICFFASLAPVCQTQFPVAGATGLGGGVVGWGAKTDEASRYTFPTTTPARDPLRP